MGRRRRFFCPSGQHPHMNTTVETPATEAPPKSRWKLWIVGFLLLGAGGYAVYRFGTGAPAQSSQQQQGRGGGPGFGGPGGRGGFGGGPRGQVVPVRVVPALKSNLDVYLRALGTVTPINTVTVRTRLDGELVKVYFTEGQRVAKGQVLAEIDTRPYQVQLAQAQGALEENRARLRNAETDLERYQKLQQEQLITAQQVVGQEALVRQLNGAIQSSEAQVASARLSLNYARIVAPIDGKLGLRQVDAGNLVRSGDANGIVVITQMRPISVLFTVPETELPPVLEAMRADRRLSVEAWDRADAVKLATGALQTVDNQIDTATGTIKLRATFDNADESLFPNQFVNIRLRVRTLQNATTIPAAAVQRASLRRVRLRRQARPGAHGLDPAGHARPDRRRARLDHERPGAAGAGRARRRRPADRRRQGRDRPRRRRAGRSADRSTPRPRWSGRRSGRPRSRRPGPGAPGAAPARPRRCSGAGSSGQGGQEGGQRRPAAAGRRHGPGRRAAAALMNLSRPFILRPVATALLMAALLLSGCSPTGCCRSRRCRRSTTRRSASSPSIRAPARR